MYSWEIEQLLKLRNYLINNKEYFQISNIKDNPQISYIKYDAYNNDFQIDTKDDYHFKFKVKKI